MTKVKDHILNCLEYFDGSREQSARLNRKNADCFGAKFSLLTHLTFLRAARDFA